MSSSLRDSRITTRSSPEPKGGDTMKPPGREIVERYMQAIPSDFDTLGELQHPDFIAEYPQSGEVIRGPDNFRAANERYSQVQTETRRVTGTEDRWILAPGFFSLTPTRIVGAGDTFTVEALATYPDGGTYHVVSILELRDGKVLRGRTYFAAPFGAPEWRAPYVEPMARPNGGKSQARPASEFDGTAEVDDFLESVLPRLRRMDTALHNGDAGPRMAMWSHNDPVTLFGALMTTSGWGEIGPAFEWLATTFSDGSYDYEVIAAGASGDLGYIVGIEHSKASIGGAPPEAYKLRVTTILRREEGEWRVVHRHADPIPDSEATRAQIARLGEQRSGG
jgi:ketosteroid isomerase-like protein